MKIVVCDDCLEDLAEIEKLLDLYQTENPNVTFDVLHFTDSAELYRRIQTEDLGDLYLLDMIMANKTGVDLGSLIRRTGRQSVIIYITSSDEYALDAYRVRAARYLLKPIRAGLFFEALDYAASDLLRLHRDAGYPVKTKEGLISVPYSQIEYIENCSRTLQVCLSSGKIIRSIFIRGSFDSEIRPLTEDSRFLHVHKSFLVNMNYIRTLAQGTIVMDSGKQIPVSKTRAAEVKKAYLMFVSSAYR